MILVTVGSCSFDKLVETVDYFRGNDQIRDRVVCQIGTGKYVPRYCDHFRAAPSLTLWYDQADLVICHGGTGTIREVLAVGKPFVAVANEHLSGNHQADFLAACEREFEICWCRNLIDLPGAIAAASQRKPRWVARRHLAEDVDHYLKSVARQMGRSTQR